MGAETREMHANMSMHWPNEMVVVVSFAGRMFRFAGGPVTGVADRERGVLRALLQDALDGLDD